MKFVIQLPLDWNHFTCQQILYVSANIIKHICGHRVTMAQIIILSVAKKKRKSMLHLEKRKKKRKRKRKKLAPTPYPTPTEK